MPSHPDGAYWPLPPTLAELAQVDALSLDDALCHALAADPWLDMIDLDTWMLDQPTRLTGPLASGAPPLARPDRNPPVKGDR